MMHASDTYIENLYVGIVPLTAFILNHVNALTDLITAYCSVNNQYY